MKIDATNYRDGLVITGMFTMDKAWVRKSAGGTYVVQVGAGEITLLDARELKTLGEALTKYADERITADGRQSFTDMVVKGA